MKHRPLPDPVTLSGFTFTFEWVRCGANRVTHTACYPFFKLIRTKRLGIGYLDSTRVGFCREHGQPFSADVTIQLERIARDRRARSYATEAEWAQIRKNKRLLAAAPALLEAAQAVLTLSPDTYAIGSSQRGSDTEWDLQRKQDALRDAIAAATGEEA